MLWEKEKMLVTGISSFSHNVFKRLHFSMKTCKKEKMHLTRRLPFLTNILPLLQLDVICYRSANVFNSNQILLFGKKLKGTRQVIDRS